MRTKLTFTRGTLTLLGLVLFFGSTGLADNTACAGAIPITPDGSIMEGTFTAAAEARWFTFQAKADRSYVWMTENTSPSDLQGVVCSFGRVLDTCTGSAPAVTAVSSQEPVGGFVTGRLSYVSTANDIFFFSVNQCFGGSTPANFRIRVVETTLTSPLFSTFGGFQTYYRFNNITNQNVSVTLKLINDAGSVVANNTFTVNASSTAPTRNTSSADLNVAPNTAGQTIITHNGTPGAIQVDGFIGLFSGTQNVVLPIKIVPAREQR